MKMRFLIEGAFFILHFFVTFNAVKRPINKS